MKKIATILLLFFCTAFMAHAQINAVEPELELLEKPTQHQMVNSVTTTMHEVILNLDEEVKVKFNNLFPVNFYKVATNDPNRLFFKIYRGGTDVREGMIRIRGEETAVMMKSYDSKGNIIWSGTRTKEGDAKKGATSAK